MSENNRNAQDLDEILEKIENIDEVKEVEVPLSVALILKQAEKQRDIAIKNQTALQNNYQKNKDALE